MSLAFCDQYTIEIAVGVLRVVFLTTTIGLAHGDMLLQMIPTSSKFFYPLFQEFMIPKSQWVRLSRNLG